MTFETAQELSKQVSALEQQPSDKLYEQLSRTIDIMLISKWREVEELRGMLHE